jgi:hypothetical protein
MVSLILRNVKLSVKYNRYSADTSIFPNKTAVCFETMRVCGLADSCLGLTECGGDERYV